MSHSMTEEVFKGGAPRSISRGPGPKASVTLIYRQTGFCSCKGLGKSSNHTTKFLTHGRKMPENCRYVKHLTEILEISSRSSLHRGYHSPPARSMSRLNFIYAGGDLSDCRTGGKELWEEGEFKWLDLCTLLPVAPAEQGQFPYFPCTLPTTVIYSMTFTHW